MASGKDFTVAIVGGGFVGLTCAIELAKSGVNVDVFEAAVSPRTLFIRIIPSLILCLV